MNVVKSSSEFLFEKFLFDSKSFFFNSNDLYYYLLYYLVKGILKDNEIKRLTCANICSISLNRIWKILHNSSFPEAN
jgi:hypothetical protein